MLPSAPWDAERRGTQGARGERGGKTVGTLCRRRRRVRRQDDGGGSQIARARAEVEIEPIERAPEETVKLREALEEAERKAKSSASIVLELQERVRELREENVGEARVLSRMEAQLRRRGTNSRRRGSDVFAARGEPFSLPTSEITKRWREIRRHERNFGRLSWRQVSTY